MILVINSQQDLFRHLHKQLWARGSLHYMDCLKSVQAMCVGLCRLLQSHMSRCHVQGLTTWYLSYAWLFSCMTNGAVASSLKSHNCSNMRQKLDAHDMPRPHRRALIIVP